MKVPTTTNKAVQTNNFNNIITVSSNNYRKGGRRNEAI